jgi:hypothetical protein
MVWVRERTIPTERPPLVGEVIANFCGQRAPRGQRDGFLRPYSRLSRREPLPFLPSCSSYSEAEWTPFQAHYFLFPVSAGNRTQASGSVAKNTRRNTQLNFKDCETRRFVPHIAKRPTPSCLQSQFGWTHITDNDCLTTWFDVILPHWSRVL